METKTWNLLERKLSDKMTGRCAFLKLAIINKLTNHVLEAWQGRKETGVEKQNKRPVHSVLRAIPHP